MVHFLRNNRNQTIIECEVTSREDLSAAIRLDIFTEELLKHYVADITNGMHFSFDMDSLNEIRGWWWEQGEDSGDYESIDKFVQEKFLDVANKWELNYIVD